MTRRGEITITRPDGRLATLVRTGQPDRAVPLPRRTTDELLAEELRRLDPDDVYNETIKRLFGDHPAGGRRSAPGDAQAQELTRRPAPARKSAAARAADVADTPSRGKPIRARKAAAKRRSEEEPASRNDRRREGLAREKRSLQAGNGREEGNASAKKAASAAKRTTTRKTATRKATAAKKVARRGA